MIKRFYKEGVKLDVAGLNKITVLLDRSETELTEIGLNEWKPGLNGPPHKHDLKNQVFYITSGEGIVKLGDQSFEARPGSLAYVPTGIVHQTITTGDEPLCYMLFNIFSDSSKEGHASFADHIEKVKEIRKQQAENVIPSISNINKEQSIYVTHGKGRITIDDETEDIKPGDLLFVPTNSAYSVKAFGNELVYLCLSGIV